MTTLLKYISSDLKAVNWKLVHNKTSRDSYSRQATAIKRKIAEIGKLIKTNTYMSEGMVKELRNRQAELTIQRNDLSSNITNLHIEHKELKDKQKLLKGYISEMNG